MIIKNISLLNYRNYETAEVNFSQNINLIYGLNAHGKTNFLEAIFLLCLSRSFRQSKNSELLNKEANTFTINGTFIKDNESEKKIVVHYIRDGKKEISINKKKINSHSKIIGHFPIVIMAPDEFRITSGGPSERRRFLDILLSQVSLTYLADLQEYNRILKQRNMLLKNIRDSKFADEASLEVWTEGLIKAGSRIINFRLKFIQSFSKILNSIFKRFEKNGDTQLTIESTIQQKNEEMTEDSFRDALLSFRKKERILGTTYVGPHRDDLLFTIDGMDVRKYGSRGQHKSLLISLKIAEYNYLYQQKEEQPLLLLDDCYSELDEMREKSAFESVQGLGQIILTSPRKNILENKDYSHRDVNYYFVKQGTIEQIEN